MRKRGRGRGMRRTRGPILRYCGVVGALEQRWRGERRCDGSLFLFSFLFQRLLASSFVFTWAQPGLQLILLLLACAEAGTVCVARSRRWSKHHNRLVIDLTPPYDRTLRLLRLILRATSLDEAVRRGSSLGSFLLTVLGTAVCGTKTARGPCRAAWTFRPRGGQRTWFWKCWKESLRRLVHCRRTCETRASSWRSCGGGHLVLLLVAFLDLTLLELSHLLGRHVVLVWRVRLQFDACDACSARHLCCST
jgi:hypothetical protein